jgi:hypothetical protein
MIKGGELQNVALAQKVFGSSSVSRDNRNSSCQPVSDFQPSYVEHRGVTQVEDFENGHLYSNGRVERLSDDGLIINLGGGGSRRPTRLENNDLQ